MAMIKREPKTVECMDEECENTFVQFNSFQRYCSGRCQAKNQKPKETKRTPLKRTPFQRSSKPMNKKSKKQAKLDTQYSRDRKEYLRNLKNKRCPVVVGARVSEIHHMMGRRGYADKWAEDNDIPLLFDQRFWLAVSWMGHEEIERNREWAEKQGFSLSRLRKADQYKIK